MIVLIPFRDEYLEPYLAAAFAAACGGAVISSQRKSELLQQVIALAEAELDLELTYPLPPDDAPLRAAMARAIRDVVWDYYPGARDDAFVATVRGYNMWAHTHDYAIERLATLSS